MQSFLRSRKRHQTSLADRTANKWWNMNKEMLIPHSGILLGYSSILNLTQHGWAATAAPAEWNFLTEIENCRKVKFFTRFFPPMTSTRLFPVPSSAQTDKLQQTSDRHTHDFFADRRFVGSTGHRWSQIMGSLMPVSASALPPPSSTFPMCLCWQNGNLVPISASPDRRGEVNLTTKWKSTAIPRSSSIGWG